MSNTRPMRGAIARSRRPYQVVPAHYGMQDDYNRRSSGQVSASKRAPDRHRSATMLRLARVEAETSPRIHGAIGCIIYRQTPPMIGYSRDGNLSLWPHAPAPRAATRLSPRHAALSRRSALTPGVGATKNAKRLKNLRGAANPEDSRAAHLLCRDAQVFLATLGGRVVPTAWRGSLPITYHVGPGAAVVHLAVKSGLEPQTDLRDVIAIIKGSRAIPTGGW